LIDDTRRRSAGDIDDMVGAEFLRGLEPARHTVETDHAARAARFRHRRSVEAKETEALDDHGVAQADVRGFGHGRHGGYAAIERSCFFVGELPRQLQDPGAGQDVAIFGKAAEEMRILVRMIMAIFAHAMTFLRHVEDFAVITLAVEEIFAPGDAVADLERIAAHVLIDSVPDLIDNADDLVAENTWAWVRPPALVRMHVGAADRRHRHPHQNFAASDGTQREFLKDERRVRRFVNSGLGSPHHSTPFSAKSKMS